MSQRLRSIEVPTLYLYSSWAVVCLGVFMVFVLTPWFKQMEAVQGGGKLILQFLGGAIGVVGAPASMIIFFGMVIFCIRQDHSPRGVKILWFIVFFATAPFGAAAYFFTVYRKQVQDASPRSSQGGAVVVDRPINSAEIPAQHDPITGRSKRAIIDEAPNGHNMTGIASFLLRAKHWQLFPPLAAGAIMQMLGLSIMSISASSWYSLTTRDYLVVFAWELGILCFLAWLGSMGLFLRSIAIPELRTRTRLFCISMVTAAVCSFALVPSQVCKASPLKPMVFPLSFLGMVCLFYMLYFVSKNLVTAEKGIPVSFEQYAGWFFLLWFFPIGVWIVQPKG